MASDANGVVLQVGDVVMMPFQVQAVSQDGNYCNLQLQSLVPIPPTAGLAILLCNSSQVVRQNALDNIQTAAAYLSTVRPPPATVPPPAPAVSG